MNGRLLAATLIVAGVAVGLFGSTYVLTVGISAAIFATVATAFNMVYGYTGLLCLGQVAFLGIGAYGSAVLSKDYGWSFWLSAPAGAGLASLFGLLIGYASLRLSRHSFGIATLTASLLCVILARNWVEVTRGSMGMPGLPAPQIGSLSIEHPRDFFWLAFAFAIISIAIMAAILSSRIGRAFLAVKGNEALARTQGLSTLGYRLLSLAISAFFTGLGGALLVTHLTIVDPSIFDFYYTETLLIMVVIGGLGHFWAVILSAIAFTVIPDLLLFSKDLRMILYGFVLIAAVLSFPKGIAGLARQRAVDGWRRRLAAQARKAATAPAAPGGQTHG